MLDFAPLLDSFLIPDDVIWPGSLRAIGAELIASRASQQAASTAWPTIGLAVGFPFTLDRPRTVYQLGWENGATPGGNFDCAILRPDGTRMVSTGSTARAGASVLQRVDVADTLLPADTYILIGAASTAAAMFAWVPLAPLASIMGLVTIAATAIPIGATNTLARGDTLAFVPMLVAQLRDTL